METWDAGFCAFFLRQLVVSYLPEPQKMELCREVAAHSEDPLRGCKQPPSDHVLMKGPSPVADSGFSALQ